jgi:hypothetical protein
VTPRERHSSSVIAKLLQDPRLFRAARRARQHRCAASTDTVYDLPMVPSPGAARPVFGQKRHDSLPRLVRQFAAPNPPDHARPLPCRGYRTISSVAACRSVRHALGLTFLMLFNTIYPSLSQRSSQPLQPSRFAAEPPSARTPTPCGPHLVS